MSAYKRAELNYKRLREERKNEFERQRIEQEKRKEKAEYQKEWRKKLTFKFCNLFSFI